MKDETLVKEQMKTIGKLQDKIKLLQFDNSRNLERIKQLERLLKRRNRMIANVREELAMMKRQNNYENVTNILKYFRELDDEK